MTYQTHSELRELIGLALSFERLRRSISFIDVISPSFLLLDSKSSQEYYASLASMGSSFDLVAVNLDLDEEQLAQLGCIRDSVLDLSNSGYDDRFYHCRL
jgi:hypothetical protein